MRRTDNIQACQLGKVAATVVFVLICAYLLVLGVGLLSLPSVHAPIADPWLTLLELIILVLTPGLMLLAVALHACASGIGRALGLCGVIFVSQTTVITMSIHFTLLTVGGTPDIAGSAWWRTAFAFQWPSVVYALDILAWDVFFALGMACLAFSVGGTRAAPPLRRWLLVSGAVAFAGLVGVFTANMMTRNVGILGYTLFLLPVMYLARRHFEELGDQVR